MRATMFQLRKPLSVCAFCVILAIFNTFMPVPTIGQEPPLFQPLVALNRKTRDLNDPELYVADYYPQNPSPLEQPKYHYQYQFDDRIFRPAEEDYVRSDDSGFLPYPAEYPGPRILEKSLTDFLEENIPKDEPNEGINKRILSSFRERMEREKSKEQHEKLTEMFLHKLQEEAENRNIDRDYDNRDYIEMIEELWEKYKNNHPNKESPIFVEEIRKRQIPIDYSTLGWSGVGYKKRSPPSDNSLYFLKYPQKDIYDEDNNMVYYNLVKPVQSDYPYKSYNPEYLYAKRKRFPVTKRSSNFYNSAKPSYHKRGVNYNKSKSKKENASGTDPKVVKDLSNIFGNKDLKKHNTTSSAMKYKKMDKTKQITKKTTMSSAVTVTPEIKTTVTSHNHESHEHNHKQKETINKNSKNDNNNNDNTSKEEPLNIKKKSIDWSNYFGIDRRKKKSESIINNDIDNDWLVKRYNNAVAMAVKRSSEYPLNFFRNHDTKRDNFDGETTEEEKQEKPIETTAMTKSSDDKKLGEMDNKLKNIEDLIIDEALKYTGAHEGETDPKELQEIKDKVISRLAAAYSLEKMRRALSEFKTNLAAQKYAGKNTEKTDELEETIKKKSAEPEKCKGNCEEDFTSRSGNEIDADKFTESLVSGSGNCNVIESRCRRLVNNGFGAAFYPICKWHQLCYLCGTDTGSPEEYTACDVIFLSRADAICQSDVVCQWAARPAVNFLREIHESAPRELATRCESNTCDVTERVFNIKRR